MQFLNPPPQKGGFFYAKIIEKYKQTIIKQEAAISFGRTMDAFEDYVPTNTSTTQQSTTQQSAGTGTQQTE